MRFVNYVAPLGVIFGLIIGCVILVHEKNSGPKPTYKVDWHAAYQHAKAGNTVRLTLSDVSTIPEGQSFTVYLVVDKDEEYSVGSVAFYGTNTASFLLDLSPVLSKLKYAPENSPKTKIELRGVKDNVKVKYTNITIELVK